MTALSGISSENAPHRLAKIDRTGGGLGIITSAYLARRLHFLGSRFLLLGTGYVVIFVPATE